jgi:hypothetical protein
MNNRNKQPQGKGAIEIIEEAVHVLRLSPPSILATYYIGSLPFILGLLFFWADMSRSAIAGKYCAVASFGLAMLFVWMKFWQAVFARQLRAHVFHESAPRWTPRRISRLATAQTLIQPSGLFVLPVAMLIVLPLGWMYAFYQNASALGDGESDDVRTVIKRSWHQATLWPRQNHIVLSILSIFGLFLVFNLAISIFLLPKLLNSLLGIETIFTKSGWSVFNTTFLTTTCGIAYLCMDPLMKAVYVLRCSHGSSLQTGEDLKAALKKFLPPKKIVAAFIVFSLVPIALGTPMAHERAKTQPVEYRMPRASVSPGELNHSIREVMKRREYTWRMPREGPSKEESDKTGLFAPFTEWVSETLRTIGRTIARWTKKLFDWLEKLLPKAEGGREPSGRGWMSSVRGLLLVLSGLLVCALAALLWRTWRRRRKREGGVVSEAISFTPDLTNDQLGADELSTDRWLALAQELMEKGEFRLVLRALYLASLAHLAEHEMITIAKYKSNRDYELELQRRAHDQLDLQAVFSHNVAMFDRTWYGMYEVTQEEMKHFTANQERIMACGEK